MNYSNIEDITKNKTTLLISPRGDVIFTLINNETAETIIFPPFDGTPLLTINHLIEMLTEMKNRVRSFEVSEEQWEEARCYGEYIEFKNRTLNSRHLCDEDIIKWRNGRIESVGGWRKREGDSRSSENIVAIIPFE